MPDTRPGGRKGRELKVTTGWGQGKRVKFIGFAETSAERGLAVANVGPSTTVITGTPGRGDAIVEIDGEQYACWFRNLDPFPARVVVVHEDSCGSDLDRLDDPDSLEQIADLGVRPQDRLLPTQTNGCQAL